MQVPDVVAVFQATAQKVKGSPNGENLATNYIDVTPDVFCAAVESLDYENEDLITGMCFHLAPYLSGNFKKLCEEDIAKMWDVVIAVSGRVVSFPAVHGVVEAVTELTLKCKEVSPGFMDFLSNWENISKPSYPYILQALMEFIPDDFFTANQKLMLTLVSSHFGTVAQTDSVLFHGNLLMILSNSKIAFEDIVSAGDLFSRIWTFIYDIAKGDQFFQITNTLDELNKTVRELFLQDEPRIDAAIGTCSSLEDFVPLVRLMPFFGQTRFEVFFGRLRAFITENPIESCQFYDVLSDSLDVSFNEDMLKVMASELVKNVTYEHDTASILLLSIYQDVLAEYGKDIHSTIAKAVSYGLNSDGPSCVLLCSVIANHADTFLIFSKMVSTLILPNLLRLLSDHRCARYAGKAIKRLISAKCLSPNCFLSDLLSPVLISKIGIEDISVLYSVLARIVDSTEENYTLNTVYRYCTDVIAGAETPPLVLGHALDVICHVKRANDAIAKSSFEICRDRAFQLLLSDQESAYIPASRYVKEYADKIDPAPIAQRMVDIAMARVACTPMTQRSVAYYIAGVCDERNMPFPAEILHAYLSHEDEQYKTRAVIIMELLLQNCPDFEALFPQALSFASVCKTTMYLNEVLVLAKQFVKSCKTKIAGIDELLYGILQARIAFFGHVSVFDYDYQGFKFYSFVSEYVRAFPRESVHVIDELIDWVPFVSSKMLVKLLKPLNAGIKMAIYDEQSSHNLWMLLNLRLQEIWDVSAACSAVLSVLVSLRQTYPNTCELSDLLQHLAFLWTMIDEDDDLRAILPQVYLDLFANEEIYPEIDPTLFQTIVTLMKEEEYEDWDYCGMIENVATILDKFGTVTDFWVMAAEMLSHFLTKHQDLDADTVEIMRKALNLCATNSESVVPKLQHMYRIYPKKWEIICEVLSIDM